MYTSIAVSALFAAGVSAHGSIVSPSPRIKGDGFKKDCGQQLYNYDYNGNIQGMLDTAKGQSDYNAAKCNLWQCRGYEYSDNNPPNNVHNFALGQTIDFNISIVAPHTGVCNVSVIDLAANSVIDQLIYFDPYASNQVTPPPNNTAFSVNIPKTLPNQCSTGGGCALQWWWNAPPPIDQTYANCVDFYIGGGN